MNLFLLNLVLAVLFAAVIGSFTLGWLVVGFVLGTLAMWVTKPLYGKDSAYFLRGARMVRLVVYFLYELVVSSIRVVWDVITPQHISRPGIVAVPLDAKTDTEIMLVANLISLTPGTLSLDVSEDRSILYVHAMFIEDVDQTIREMKDGMERRLLEVTR